MTGGGGGEGRGHRAPAAPPARPALLGADRPLDHLDVAVAPLLDALVEVDQALGDERRIGVLGVRGDQHVLDPRVGGVGIGRDSVSPLRQIAEERLPDRGR